jgi:hypothetical protein
MDGFIAVTIYDGKHPNSPLYQKTKAPDSVKAEVRPGAQVFDKQFRQVLLYIA